MAGTGNETQNTLTKHLRPTLLIGLGGTGKDVLLRIRRLFFERYGRKDRYLGPPVIGYLALDTDHDAFTRIEGEKLSNFLLKKIEFEPLEMIGCQILANEFNEIFDAKEDYIFRWLDEGLRRFGSGAITSGAGQNRQFGRLAFFRHFKEIEKRIRAKLAGIVDHAKDPTLRDITARDNVRIDQKQLEVILIYSLAGGTGRGCSWTWASWPARLPRSCMAASIAPTSPFSPRPSCKPPGPR